MMPPMSAPPPMGPPPPGMGGSPAAPPPPPMQLDNPDVVLEFLDQVQQMIDQMGEDSVRDMLSALPPDILEELYTLINEDVRAAIVLGDLLDPPEREPQYEAWYEDLPKPTMEECIDAAEQDHGTWSEVANRIKDDLLWYHGEWPNTFKNFDKKKEDYFYSGIIRADADTKIAILGNAPITFQVPFLEMELEDATQKAENFLYYILQCWKAQYAKTSGGRDIRHDIEWYREVTGWVFYECALDTRGGKPFVHRLHDPTTCFPVWDEYGLLRITRSYTDTVINVIAAYDNNDGDVRKALIEDAMPRKDGKIRPLLSHETVTVTYYIDRTWRALYVDDIEIIAPVKHKYGCVPFVVGGSGLGEPTNLMSAAVSSDVSSLITYGDANLRMRYKNMSGFDHLKRLHAQREAVLTKLFNMASRMDRQDWIVEQDDYAESEGVPTIKRGGNEVTSIKRGHEALTPLIETVGGDFFEPLVGAIANEDLRSLIPLSQHGVGEGSQQSGNQIESKIESGREKFAVQMQSAELFWGEVAGLWLRLYRDHGHLVPNHRGEYGRQTVAYSSRQRWMNPKRPAAFDLTPEMLDHIGVEVEATLTTLRMQNLGPLGNSVAIWMTNKAMSAREAMELRGVRDPDMVFKEQEYEEILFDPEIRKLKKLKIMRERDPELAVLYEKSMMSSGSQQAPPTGLGAGGPMAPNTSAMNLQGMGLGQQGPTGRPPDGVDVPPGMMPAPGPGGMSY